MGKRKNNQERPPKNDAAQPLTQLESTEESDAMKALKEETYQQLDKWREQQRSIGHILGYLDGVKKGRQEGKAAMALQFLAPRLDVDPGILQSRLDKLSEDNLDKLGEIMGGFTTRLELGTWLVERFKEQVLVKEEPKKPKAIRKSKAK